MTATATADGVRVTKAFETDEFPVPTVTFDVTSERDEPVTVRVVDVIPEDFQMDHVGFHPDYGSENWTAYPDQRVEFERRLEPGETVRTVYGVRLDDPSADDRFMDDPDISVDAAGEFGESDGEDPVAETTMADIAPRERTDVVRDVAGGDADAVPGMEAEPPDAEAEAAAGLGEDPLGLEEHETGDDADDRAEAEAEPAPESAAEPEDEVADTVAQGSGGAMPGNLAAALAAEIRAGDVDDEDLAVIEDAVGSRRSEEVQLEHLQSRVSELEAYADALEAFIDENGTAAELLEDVERDVESLGRRVDGLAEDVSQGGTAREDLAAQVETLQAELAAVEGVASDVEAIGDDLTALRGDLEAVEERVAGVESDLEEVSDPEEAIADVAEDVAAVRDTVEGVADDVSAVESEVSELQVWREDLSSVLGGS